MKHFPIKTAAGILFQAAAMACIYFHQVLLSQIFALLGSSLVSQDIPKFSSWLQYFFTWTASLVLGQSIEYGDEDIPLITIGLFIAASGMLLRTAFYKVFVHTRFLWLDPLLLILGAGLYVAGNLSGHYSWQGWVFALPPFIFGSLLITGFVKEGLSYRRQSEAGYKAQLGKPAPDFTLPDAEGNPVSLSEFRSKRHVLLLFLRGDWCPACHMMLRTYEHGRKKFQEKNVFLLAVGPDSAGINKDMAQRLGIEFCILSDEEHKVSGQYGVYLEEDPVQNPLRRNPDDGLPLPASFLICDRGIVRYHSSPERVGEFLDPSLIFKVLEKI